MQYAQIINIDAQEDIFILKCVFEYVHVYSMQSALKPHNIVPLSGKVKCLIGFIVKHPIYVEWP